jgi:hypothetical protein
MIELFAPLSPAHGVPWWSYPWLSPTMRSPLQGGEQSGGQLGGHNLWLTQGIIISQTMYLLWWLWRRMPKCSDMLAPTEPRGLLVSLVLSGFEEEMDRCLGCLWVGLTYRFHCDTRPLPKTQIFKSWIDWVRWFTRARPDIYQKMSMAIYGDWLSDV